MNIKYLKKNHYLHEQKNLTRHLFGCKTIGCKTVLEVSPLPSAATNLTKKYYSRKMSVQNTVNLQHGISCGYIYI